MPNKKGKQNQGASASTTTKVAKNQRKRAARRARKAQSSSQPFQLSGRTGVAAAYSPGPMTSLVPQMNMSSGGESCRIRHREYVRDLTSPGQFVQQIIAYPINPGLDVLFAWLSQVAQRFETYQFRKLRFCWEPILATAVSGTAVLGLDYDANDVVPTTKQQIMSFKSSVRAACWQPCCLDADLTIDDRGLSGRKYVRSGLPAGSAYDLKTYDVGFFISLTSVGVTTGSLMGELYVEYDVELFTPQTNVNPGQLITVNVPTASNLLSPAAPVAGNIAAAIVASGIQFLKSGSWLAAFDLNSSAMGSTADNLVSWALNRVTGSIGSIQTQQSVTDSGGNGTISYATIINTSPGDILTATLGTTITALPSFLRLTQFNNQAA